MEPSQVIFLVVFVASLAIAFALGGNDERLAGAGMLLAALISPLVEDHAFREVEVGILLVDLGLLTLLGAIAIRSDRYWPLFATGFLLTGAMIHLFPGMLPSMHPDTYADLTIIWAYPIQLSLMFGTLVEAQGRKGADVSDRKAGRFQVPSQDRGEASRLDRNAPDAQRLPTQLRGARYSRPADLGSIPRRDLELLTRLFRNHGLGVRSLPLAVHLLAQTGDLGSLIATPPERLQQLGVLKSELAILASVGEAIATVLDRRAKDRPLLNNADAVLDYLHASMAYLHHEVFRVLFLNSRNHLMHDEIMFRGTLDQAMAYPREIVLRALEVGSAALIVVHNHPSGDPEPSREDILFTRRLISACNVMDVMVHDHLIIGRSGHASLRALGHFD